MPGTVTVACKLPNGLCMRLDTLVEVDEATQGGVIRSIKRAQDLGVEVIIKGNRAPFGQQVLGPDGEPIPIVRGYALTVIDADFWDHWFEINKMTRLVTEGLVFAHSSQRDARAEAKEKENVVTGLEPMDPDGDKRHTRRRFVHRGGQLAELSTSRPGSS